jgi:hypothetical protein
MMIHQLNISTPSELHLGQEIDGQLRDEHTRRSTNR